tara:strand:+ start:360719 stop:360853 length:135 start_codon:yes stop_codon:yes gene_type:complete
MLKSQENQPVWSIARVKLKTARKWLILPNTADQHLKEGLLHISG